ncbi:MAG: CRISPR-associated endonuclease Cas1, partial [Alphaproteobacteria bacterium]|nr:CRISPR-associated endonuclease Cas1 [Alphaproteobacteria bacterium]
MLKGRLGLDKAEIRHEDRHPFIALRMGALTVEDGCMVFSNAAERLHIPYQTLSAILLEPGVTISHDVLRLAARHGLALVCTGLDGVRCYTAPPLQSDMSDLSRQQVRAWSDVEARHAVIRWQFHNRFGGNATFHTVEEARGMEGARVKAAYQIVAKQY